MGGHIGLLVSTGTKAFPTVTSTGAGNHSPLMSWLAALKAGISSP